MNEIANGYLQLGIAGATLFILLILVVSQFKSSDKRDKSSSKLLELQLNKVDKLCDKIDALITSNAQHSEMLNGVLLANDKDQKETLSRLDNIALTQEKILTKVVRIDDRTYNCLGTPGERREEFGTDKNST